MKEDERIVVLDVFGKRVQHLSPRLTLIEVVVDFS